MEKVKASKKEKRAIKREKPILFKEDNGVSVYNLLVPHDINALVDNNMLSTEIAEGYKAMIENNNKFSQQYSEFLKRNPDHTEHEMVEFFKEFNPRTAEQAIQECQIQAQFITTLENNWDECFAIFNKVSPETRLFNDININESFGIPRQITDFYNKMKHILENAELKNDDNGYFIRGETTLSNGDKLSLEHDLNTNSMADALKALEEYKECMLSKGLRAWMAYWRVANEYADTAYTCRMIKVMEKIANADRNASFFSQKEKNDFWSTTRMLTNTRIKIEKSFAKTTQWIEQPLIEILGGERENDKVYPEIIQVSLLRRPYEKFFPAVYKNSTLNLHPKETYLAFYIQTRAAQLENGNRIMKTEWPYLYSLGCVEKTANTNPRAAKNIIRKKMRKLEEEGIVETFSEYPDGLMITPKIQKIKKKII